jgi:uncharacterized protein (DUF1330 family)
MNLQSNIFSNNGVIHGVIYGQNERIEELNQRYAQFAIPILIKHGGQMIAGTPTPSVKEGDWNGNWAAVLQFPSM